uniref:Uncharacterized protein n=1 Tax=Arundo donax TaxID=35708 RepID=A0A0A8YEY4_ARUDO
MVRTVLKDATRFPPVALALSPLSPWLQSLNAVE